jgi:hypothetical protein
MPGLFKAGLTLNSKRPACYSARIILNDNLKSFFSASLFFFSPGSYEAYGLAGLYAHFFIKARFWASTRLGQNKI